ISSRGRDRTAGPHSPPPERSPTRHPPLLPSGFPASVRHSATHPRSTHRTTWSKPPACLPVLAGSGSVLSAHRAGDLLLGPGEGPIVTVSVPGRNGYLRV